MKPLIGTLNLCLIFSIAISTGVLLGVAGNKAIASVNGPCPISQNLIQCQPGETQATDFIGNACATSSTEGCCQYFMYRVYCNGVYKGITLLLIDRMKNGTCVGNNCALIT